MADRPDANSGYGCLWLVAVAVFLPAGFVAAAIWPESSPNQFVARTILVGIGSAAAVIVLGGAAALHRHRNDPERG